jgi:hypothetical protein
MILKYMYLIDDFQILFFFLKELKLVVLWF